jgi:hypothetical protein
LETCVRLCLQNWKNNIKTSGIIFHLIKVYFWILIIHDCLGHMVNFLKDVFRYVPFLAMKLKWSRDLHQYMSDFMHRILHVLWNSYYFKCTFYSFSIHVIVMVC